MFYLAYAYSKIKISDKEKMELVIGYVNNYIDAVES